MNEEYNMSLPFVHTLRYVVRFPLEYVADGRDKRGTIDKSYSHMPPLQTFVFAVYHVSGLDGWLVSVEMSVTQTELKPEAIEHWVVISPPTDYSGSAYCSVPHAIPCWVFVVSLVAHCTCWAWLDVPIQRKNVTPTHLAIIECHKLDMSCDLLLTLDQRALVFSDQSLVKRDEKVLHTNYFFSLLDRQEHNYFFINFQTTEYDFSVDIVSWKKARAN